MLFVRLQLNFHYEKSFLIKWDNAQYCRQY